MTEQLGAEQSPDRPKSSPDWHLLEDFHPLSYSTDITENYGPISKLFEKYGEQNVKVERVITNDNLTGAPETLRIYVNAQKWIELNAASEASQQASTDI